MLALLLAATVGCMKTERPKDTLLLTLSCNVTGPMPDPRGATDIRIVALGGPHVWNEWGSLDCANGSDMRVAVSGVSMVPPFEPGPCLQWMAKEATEITLGRRLATAGGLLGFALVAVIVSSYAKGARPPKFRPV